ncbi:MAG: hydroxymethylbilane synthase, partial [Myxococcota bacterium]
MSASSTAKLRIGSRGSDLALWQARFTSSHIDEPNDIVIIKTEGDRIQHLSLDKVEGKGFFTKEIEAALLAGDVDVAVHSFKDLPIEQPAGLSIAAVPARGPTRDVVLRRADGPTSTLLWGLAQGARVGTSSLRRKAQILSLRPDLELVDLRGNVPTRVRKVVEGALDAVILAEAGLVRLGFAEHALRDGLVLEVIAAKDVCPAPA